MSHCPWSACSGLEARQSHSELCEVKCTQCCSSAPTQGMHGHCEGQGNVGMDEQRGCAWLRREGKGWEVDQADAAKRALASRGERLQGARAKGTADVGTPKTAEWAAALCGRLLQGCHQCATVKVQAR
ncbi:hypothetical protein HaLaN_29902 [Haematococcus lacustris]|uniref:Uncharacterized protein n=1 Tax=Haematococcus lacustris TaxID=44745 RepID=A0A6A0AEE2_HAELA|nr:hypothetical protein HaLaN_29902 [Haematococcus lacustris]